MKSLREILDEYLVTLERSGSLTPTVVVGLDGPAWTSMKIPKDVAVFDDLKSYFARINGYNRKLCDELDIYEPELAWEMHALSAADALRHHENTAFASSENADYWPPGFLPILWDGAGSYLVVNCVAGSKHYGAIYDMADGVGCNRVAASLTHFFAASAQEIRSGLRTYARDRSKLAVDPKEYLVTAAALFDHSPYFSRVGRMDTQVVDWK